MAKTKSNQSQGWEATLLKVLHSCLMSRYQWEDRCLRLKTSTFKLCHVICQLGLGLDSVDSGKRALFGHLYLSGMWFGVASRTYTKNMCAQKNWITCSKCDNHFKFNSQHNFYFCVSFFEGGEGRLHTHLMSMKIFSFGNEPDLYEESDHILDFDLLSILHLSCVSYPRRSGLVKISNRLGVVYLTT